VGQLTGHVLLTGGSGTLGRATLLYAQRKSRPAVFTVLARSESRLARLKKFFPRVRTIIGDVVDRTAMYNAVVGHDLVIHMAAMKRIPECEQQPRECFMVNVLGTQYVLDACSAAGVPCVIISTDKACRAATTYGASKLMTESLLSWNSQRNSGVPHVGVRYGNVIASTGSVVQIWQEQASAGVDLTITMEGMTRFWMSPFDAVRLIEDALDIESGGIAVPKMSSLGLEAMAEMLHPDSRIKITGLRSNEKAHEDLIHPHEPVREEAGRYIVHTGAPYPTGFMYTSAGAPRLTRDGLYEMLEDAREVEACS
jgi:UDP-N-acetylglucosamine 4,6-dehydratase/5-epimerase